MLPQPPHPSPARTRTPSTLLLDPYWDPSSSACPPTLCTPNPLQPAPPTHLVSSNQMHPSVSPLHLSTVSSGQQRTGQGAACIAGPMEVQAGQQHEALTALAVPPGAALSHSAPESQPLSLPGLGGSLARGWGLFPPLWRPGWSV